MKFILGKKIEMTQIFADSGEIVPVTRVAAGPCFVTQVKKADRGGVNAVQIGFGVRKEKQATKALLGHLKGLSLFQHMRDFDVEENTTLERGDELDLASFAPGDKVTIVGTSKGRGFQGVVKRHGFAGHPKTHGHKDQLRMPGSIGAGGPGRVFRGVRMAGRMGGDSVTVKNLVVVKVDAQKNELLVRGAVPGAKGGFIMVYAPGEMKKVTKEVKADAAVEPVVVAEPVPAPEQTVAVEQIVTSATVPAEQTNV